MNYRLINPEEDYDMDYSISEHKYNSLTPKDRAKYEPDEENPDENFDEDESETLGYDVIDAVADTVGEIIEEVTETDDTPEMETDEMGGGDFGGGGSSDDY